MRGHPPLLHPRHVFILLSFDLELPLCCDDEYLGDLQESKQPEEKPSRASYFVWMIKLSQIQGLALRTIVSISLVLTWEFSLMMLDWI